MFHGATGTQTMAFPNNVGVDIAGRRREDIGESVTDSRLPQGRSFANAASTTERNNSTSGSLNAGFGSRGNAWGSSSIWSGGITSNLGASTAPRDTSTPRDAAQQSAANTTKVFEGKTGSGSLVDSSVCDEYATRPSWGASRNSNSTRSIPRFTTEGSLAQQRGLSNAGMSQTSVNTNTMSYPSRTANLTSTAPAQARPSFGSAYQAGTGGRGNDNAPFHVYTKFDRPSDPMLARKDSPTHNWMDAASTPSPTDERRPQYPIQHSNGRISSMPTSRDGSDPPSRHSDQKPIFQYPQYDLTSQRETSVGSRAPSIASSRQGGYNDYLHPSTDQLAIQFGQFNFTTENRPSTSFRSSFSNGQGNPTAGRGSLSYGNNSIPRPGSVEEVPRSSRNHSIHDDYNMPQQANGFSYPGSQLAERFLQSGGAHEFRPGQPYQSNTTASRAYDMPGGARQSTDWNYTNGSTSATSRAPGLPDQLTYTDPRVQQFMAAQFRNPYASLYNQFAVQNALQLTASPYSNMMPMNMNMNMTLNPHDDAPPTPQESTGGDVPSFQSRVMFDFKNNPKTKRYELRDIYTHIAEFSGDQHGSRFIQTKLETANSDEKARVFAEIELNAIQLMTDVFGNYVIQKFFEHGDQIHKKTLANKMRGHVLTLSLQMYGCRVVQKALDHVLVDQQALLIGELENHVTKCVKDQNGNHVIQKAIERCPPATIEFIIAAFRGQVQQLSIHAYGCRVIQRCLEKCDLPAKAMIMSELVDGIPTMISDQFGNYVVQHIVCHGDEKGRNRVLRIVGDGLEGYSKHKFASNVVEKCLERADDTWRRNVVVALARAQQQPRRMDMLRESEGVLVNMIKDNFGNYVIRKMHEILIGCAYANIPTEKLLDTLCRDDYFMFLDVLHPAMVQAKRSGCGKQVLSIEKKMHRFEEFINGVPPGPQSYGRLPYQMASMSMGMPAPSQQFIGNYNSAATTPPSLTADNQSIQSSRVPSVNGDAIEGASASRKGSEQSNGFY